MSQETTKPLIPAASSPNIDARTRRGRLQMILLLLVCASPVIASYFTFYVLKPEGGKTNYGQLVSPVQSFPHNTIDDDLTGKWTLLVARPAGDCKVGDDACVSLLYLMRQVRIAMSKERTRLQLVWLITDSKPIDPEIAKAYDHEVAGFKQIRLPTDLHKKKEVLQWLNLDQGAQDIHLLDPRGDRMMRFTTDQGLPDFKKVSKDMEKLLKWNPTGKVGS